MSTRKLSENSKQAIKDTFALFDSDKDGKVSKTEIGGMMRTLGYGVYPRQLDEIFDKLDSNKNGYVDYKEFEQFALNIDMVRNESSDDLRAAFDILDQNQDGFIEESEIEYFMSKFGDKDPKTESKQTIMDADKNGDGKIDYNEYVQHMKGKI